MRQDFNLLPVLSGLFCVHFSSLHKLAGNSDRVGAGFVMTAAWGAPRTALSSLSLHPYFAAQAATAEECLANPVDMDRYSMDTSSAAFSHRGSLAHSSSQYYKRLNSGDGHLGGGPATTTSGSRTNPVPSGGPSTPGLRFPASSPKSNEGEGNRCGNVMPGLASWEPNAFHPCPGDTAQGGWWAGVCEVVGRIRVQ